MIAYLTITAITFLYVNLVLAVKIYTIVNPPFNTKMYDYIDMEVITNDVYMFTYYYKKVKLSTYLVDLKSHTITDKVSGVKLYGFYPKEILLDYNEFKRNIDIKSLIE